MERVWGAGRGGARAAWRAMIAALFLAAACASCAPLPEAEPIGVACTATDGDTLRCGEERIRLLGIDAPELGGRCRQGRVCVDGDADAARAALAAALRQAQDGGPLTIRRMGKDRYGRTLGAVMAADGDLSCAQLARGVAVYVRRWDERRVVARACPHLVR